MRRWRRRCVHRNVVSQNTHIFMCVPKGISLFSSVIDQVIEENVEDGKVGTSRLDVIVPDINK